MPPWKWLKSLYYKDFQDFWQLFYSRFDGWWRYFAKSKFLRKRWRWPLKLLRKRCISNLLSLQFYYSLIYCISSTMFEDFLLLYTKTSNWILPTNDISWLWIGVLPHSPRIRYSLSQITITSYIWIPFPKRSLPLFVSDTWCFPNILSKCIKKSSVFTPAPFLPLCNTFSLNLLTTVTLNVISIV